MIPDHKIQEIKDKLDIVTYIGESVHLKKSGSNYIGLCPFHNEKTPSFTVSQDKRIFRCFGCGEGGDIISYAMKRENLNYPEAIKFLADKAGIFLEEDEAVQKRQQYYLKLYRINEEAKLFYYQKMLENSLPKAYLRERGLNNQCINRFFLGYADDQWSSLAEYLSKKGYPMEDVEKLGLVTKSKKNHQYYDRFRNRLMFPIINTKKNIIGFGGRTLVNDPAKYINSPESPIFHKGKSLYGLNIIHNNQKRDYIILVEGYLDVIAMHHHGINSAVACLGTSLTTEQAELMKRYGKDVYICYDADEAGIKAAKKAIKILQDIQVEPKIIRLPDKMDPDDFLRVNNIEAFEALRKNALSPINYQIAILKSKYNVTDFQQKLQYLNEISLLLSTIEREIIRDEYITKLSKESGVSQDALRKDVIRHLQEKSQNHHLATQHPEIPGHRGQDRGALHYEASLVGQFVVYMLSDKNYYLAIKDKLASVIEKANFKEWMDFFSDCYDIKNQTAIPSSQILSYFQGKKNTQEIVKMIHKFESQKNQLNKRGFLELNQKWDVFQLRKRKRTLEEEIDLISHSDIDKPEMKKILDELLGQLMKIDKQLKM